PPEHMAAEPAPALSSHLEDASHVMWLPVPPMPLHSDVSPHVRVAAAVDEALHFAAVLHARLQADAPQLALQSVPAVQVQPPETHEQPAPVHAGTAPPLLPHDASRPIAAARDRQSRLGNRAAVIGSPDHWTIGK